MGRFRSELLIAAIWVISAACSSFVAADEVVKADSPAVGWDGYYVVGRWTPVVVPVNTNEPVEMEVTAVDSDGNRVGYLSPKMTLADGQRQVAGVFKVGRLKSEMRIRINQQPEIVGTSDHSSWLQKPLEPSAKLIVTVGEPKGFTFAADLSSAGRVVKVATVNVASLPTNPLAYDAVSSLILAGPDAVTAAQSTALRDWVGSGGRLVISLPHNTDLAKQVLEPLKSWLPVTLGEQPVTVREFGGLETYSGKNVRIPQTTTLAIPQLRIETGEVLAASRSDSFLVRAPYGMGAVTVLAMDLTTAPLAEWKSLPLFCARLAGLGSAAESAEKVAGKGSQLGSTGVSDLATQLHATQDDFEKIHRASPWFVMAMLLGLLIVVGPIDYFVVHRILRRPHLTWVTYPLLVALSASSAAYVANASNGTTRRANQLDIVDIDVPTATARGHHFVMLYSPTTAQSSVSIKPVPLVAKSADVPPAHVSWQGTPETSFGGMLHDASFEQGAKYQQQPDGQLTGLPILQWSSKSLVGETVQSAEGLVDCDLRASATGRLTGTLTHRLPGPLEDWMIVYKNVVYRHLKKKDEAKPIPLVPQQVWRVEQPSVFTRELRPFLTGATTFATPRSDLAMGSDFKNQSAAYDPLSRDPSTLIRVLTFHDDVGGERYTGLTNLILANEDCSRLLKLGRAVLFGRLEQPVVTVEQDQTAIEPDRRTTFVRLILPVASSTEVIRELRRLVPD